MIVANQGIPHAGEPARLASSGRSTLVRRRLRLPNFLLKEAGQATGIIQVCAATVLIVFGAPPAVPSAMDRRSLAGGA